MQRAAPARTSRRLTAIVAIVAIAAAACASDSDDDSDQTDATESTESQAGAPDTTPPATTAPETTAPDTTPATTVPETTLPETTLPATTQAETTSPDTTVPDTTTPETTAPAPSEAELSQFCFDSEQVYVANVVMSDIGEATPAQAEAATASLAFWVGQAVDSAPAGLDAEPLAAQTALDELIVIFDEYGYDADAILGGPDGEQATELVTEFNAVIEQLVDFLADACNSQFVVLNSQAEKLAAVIEDAVTWPLVAVTNVAGDIRLLVPPEWSDWLGSTTIEEITFLQASPDNAVFETDWGIPGMVATVAYVEIGLADPETRLGVTLAAQDCQPVSTEPYSDPVYSGSLHVFEACAGTTTAAAVLLVTDDASESVEIVLEFQFPDGIDRELLDQMLATFAAGA